MKKASRFILSVLVVLFSNLIFTGVTDAANVAVVPIRIDETKVERAGDFYSYYWDVMVEKFQFPEFELVDDDKVAKALPAEGLKTFDQTSLDGVLKGTDADIVVAMRLDEVVEKADTIFEEEPMLDCRMSGEFVSYNKVTGKFFRKKFNYHDRMEEVLTLKTDWQQHAFASNLRRFISRTMEGMKPNKY